MAAFVCFAVGSFLRDCIAASQASSPGPRGSGSPRSPRQSARTTYTADEIAEFRSVFQVNLPVGDTAMKLPADRLGKVLRSLGMAPTERQLSAATIKSGGNPLAFDELLDAILEVSQTPITEERAKAAFGFFDGAGHGQIAVDELRTLLSTRGEPLAPDQLDAFLAGADPEGKGFVEISAIVALCA